MISNELSPPRPALRGHRSAALLLIAAFACLRPAAAQNLIANPGFESGISPWFAFGGASLGTTTAPVHAGGGAAMVTARSETWQGVACDLRGVVSSGQYLAIGGFALHDAPGEDELRLTLRQIDDAGTRYHRIDSRRVPGGTWTALSGTLTLHVRGALKELVLYFEGPAPGVTLHADEATLTVLGDWRTAASERIEAHRKRDARIRVRDCCGALAVDVPIEVRQIRHAFAFGSALNTHALHDPAYADFFRQNFEWAVLENESKWWVNEPRRGHTRYTEADLLLDFCAASDIQVRGHSLFWDVPSWVQPWLKELDDLQLRQALEDRLESAAGHFAGRFRHWDVNNEILHGGFYGSRLGGDIYPWMFQRAHQIDPTAMLMVNDHNVIEGDDTGRYVQQIAELRAAGAPLHAIGAQGHFSGVDPLEVLSRFDQLAATGLVIWVTEYDSVQADEQRRADDLEALYRAAFSHPAVDGVFLWGFWAGSIWRGEDAAIVNLDWSLNEAGRRYQALRAAWTTNLDLRTDASGEIAFRGFHGRYEIRVPSGTGPALVAELTLAPGSDEVLLELPFECRHDRRTWLLRNDEMAALGSRETELARIFNDCARDSLDLLGPDGIAGAGEGGRLSAPGSDDDDDAYLLDFRPGAVEPDRDIVADATRPLVFYQITYPGLLRAVKSAAGLRLYY